jgi:two-component system sensor histidine kinase RegB
MTTVATVRPSSVRPRLHDSAGAASPPETAAGAALPWLIRLRWLALLAFLALPLGSSAGLDGRVAPAPFIGLIVALALTNGLLWRQTGFAAVARPSTVALVLALDTGLLTVLLSLTGGAANPGTVVYLVHVTFAAVLLGPLWTWLLTVLSIGGYGVLVFFRPVLAEVTHVHGAPTGTFESHVLGMWVAFAATAALIAHFVGRVSQALAARERELADLRATAARNERLAALTTLAAGAAHELATPLATIAVTAREIERVASRPDCPCPQACASDAALIAREVARCHRTLDEMSGRARGLAFDAGPLALPGAFDDARRQLQAGDASRIAVSGSPDEAFAELPHDDLVRVIVALFRNALDASAPGGTVRVRAAHADGTLTIGIEDDGHGMSPEVLARVDEPFFTTKPPGHGFGLGVFLARSVVEQLGGALDISSVEEVGTTVTLRLPTGRAA